MTENKMYFALVDFFTKQEGWLSIKAASPEEAKATLMKEFGSNEGIKDFNILEVRDTPPILPVVEDDEDEDKEYAN